jgi:hypothetical protein
MILPTKRLNEDRALLSIGADVLALLDSPKTVSRLWEELKQFRERANSTGIVPYDWFVLSLDLLYAVDAVSLDQGRLRRAVSS